jgi:hypothetical protein
MEYSLIEAINKAVKDLHREAERVARGKKCIRSITCGELQKIKENAEKSTRLLAKIVFAEDDDGTNIERCRKQTPNRYLTDMAFVEAVQEITKDRLTART